MSVIQFDKHNGDTVPELDLDGTAASSTATTDVSTAAASSTAEASDDNPGSSPEQAREPLSPIDVVDAALKGEEETPASDEQDTKTSSESEDEAEAEQAPEDEADLSDLKDVSERTKARFDKLLGERGDLRTQVDELTPKAQEWDKVEQFREANGLSPADMAQALQFMALSRNDPRAALEQLRPQFEMLQSRAGEVLTPDLEAAVASGQITREHALSITRAQAAEAQTRAQAERGAKSEETRRQQEALTQRTEALTTVTESWEKTARAGDPDFMLKRNEIAAKAESIMRSEGMPEDDKGMRTLLDRAKKEVDGFANRFIPKKPAVIPDPASVSSPGRTKPEKFDSPMDAVNFALGQT